MTPSIVSLFSGIGGLDLGVERAGLGRTVAQVEFEAFQTRVLERRWPNGKHLRDVREANVRNMPRADFVVGGFPCTGFSRAGKRDGLKNPESRLWFDMLRIITELKPRGVIIENVREMLKFPADMKTIYAGLDDAGYEVDAPIGIDASEVGAPHRRERVFIVAIRKKATGSLTLGRIGAPISVFPAPRGAVQKTGEPPRTTEKFKRIVNKRERIEAHGNAVVPDVGLQIGLHLRRRLGGEAASTEVRLPPRLEKPIGYLNTQARFWPTVITTDCKGSRRNTARTAEWTCNPGESLTDAVWVNDPADHNRPLNADWTEVLMGFPRGFTDPLG